MAGWDDVPHLTEAQKTDLLSAYPPHQRDVRSKGIPRLGAGAIYPIDESLIAVEDFSPIPKHWPKAFGMDVGWNRTAVVWGAKNPDTQITYLYSEHYAGSSEPMAHAAAIKARGAWIPGAIDPAADGRSQVDGRNLFQMYLSLGLNIEKADNAVEAGIATVWTALSSGQLKVFRSLVNWLAERRLFRRDATGKPVRPQLSGVYSAGSGDSGQVGDHLMAATRYLLMTGMDRAKTCPVPQEPETRFVPTSPYGNAGGNGGWMA